MNKIIIMLCLLLTLTSCFGEQKEKKTLKDLKNELLGKTPNTNMGDDSIPSENTSDVETPVSQTGDSMSVKYLTEEKLLKFNDFTAEDFKSLQKEITGKTLGKVDKIIVTFSNADAGIKPDSFQLRKFKAGDTTFLYRAFKKYKTVAYGKNVYIFEAHSGNTVSKLELTVTLEKEKKKPVTLEDLPIASSFGNPIKLGNGKVTYSDIKGLEIENVGNIDLKFDSTSVTKYLKGSLDSWFYWNTFRKINDGEGLSFYVVEKQGDTYKYSKHYYNGNGLYGVLDLETGDLVVGEGEDIGEVLKQKNAELIEKNTSFTITKISDELFNKLTQ